MVLIPNHTYQDFIQPDLYLSEFREFLQNVPYTERNPLNTEMFFLWCMIRAQKPELFIESGTYRGYSAHFICEALKRNANGAQFITYGYNLDNCLPYAAARLVEYPFAMVIEGDSRRGVTGFKGETRPTAFFIDGPKGRNMPALFFAILKNFTNIQFVAIHDCEPGGSSGNRAYVEDFFSFDRQILYCDAHFQEQFSNLDGALIGRSEMLGWKPYFRDGQPISSYGTETCYVFPDRHVSNNMKNLNLRLLRWLRFNLFLTIKNHANKLLRA